MPEIKNVVVYLKDVAFRGRAAGDHARRSGRSTRRSCRTCWRSRADRQSTSRTTIRSSTTSSRCRARRRSTSAATRRDSRSQTVHQGRPREGLLPHPLAHERDDPRARSPVLRDARRSTARSSSPNVPPGDVHASSAGTSASANAPASVRSKPGGSDVDLNSLPVEDPQ